MANGLMCVGAGGSGTWAHDVPAETLPTTWPEGKVPGQQPLAAWLIGGAVTTNVHGPFRPPAEVRTACAVAPLVSVFFHMCSVSVERTSGRRVHPSALSRAPTSLTKAARVPAEKTRACTTTDDQPAVPGRPSQLVWCGSDSIRYGSVGASVDDLNGRADVP
jgi:hypothetical protein